MSCELLTSSCMEKSAFVIRIIYGHRGIGVGILRAAVVLLKGQNWKVLTYAHAHAHALHWRHPAGIVFREKWLRISTSAVWGADTPPAAWRTFTSLCSSISLCGCSPEQDSLFPVVFLCKTHYLGSQECVWQSEFVALGTVFPQFTVCGDCSTVRRNQWCTARMHYLHRNSNKK